ncbi:MAG: YeiH family protein [Phycisphaerales bacterium]
MPDRPTNPASELSARAALFLAFAAFFTVPWTLVPGAGAVARWAKPEFALAAGIVLALAGLGAFEKRAKSISRLLIQIIVVLVGLRIDLGDVVRFGGVGLLLGTGVIVTTFAVGLALARVLRTDREMTTLLCSGTAVCGGSAIAAVGSAIAAAAPAMAVSLGVVFILNAAALYLMPFVGNRLGMNAAQFGTWAGLAIHDYSSVVAAARAWDDAHAGVGVESLARGAEQAATVTKGTRVLWIMPIAVGAAWWARRSGAKADDGTARRFGSPVPWFIIGFLIASAIRTALPAEALAADGTVLFRRAAMESAVKLWTGVAMSAALFLIGTGLSRRTLAAVGWRALVVGVLLWLVIGAGSLLVVRAIVA